MKNYAQKPLKVGIMPWNEFKNRALGVAAGQLKTKPGEPKVWFESIRSLAQVLSPENQQLLSLIVKHNPQSLAELEQLSHRKKSNLSRTLRTLEHFGIVELPMHCGRLVPKVNATEFQVEFGLGLQKPVAGEPAATYAR